MGVLGSTQKVRGYHLKKASLWTLAAGERWPCLLGAGGLYYTKKQEHPIDSKEKNSDMFNLFLSYFPFCQCIKAR